MYVKPASRPDLLYISVPFGCWNYNIYKNSQNSQNWLISFINCGEFGFINLSVAVTCVTCYRVWGPGQIHRLTKNWIQPLSVESLHLFFSCFLSTKINVSPNPMPATNSPQLCKPCRRAQTCPLPGGYPLLIRVCLSLSSTAPPLASLENFWLVLRIFGLHGWDAITL